MEKRNVQFGHLVCEWWRTLCWDMANCNWVGSSYPLTWRSPEVEQKISCTVLCLLALRVEDTQMVDNWWLKTNECKSAGLAILPVFPCECLPILSLMCAKFIWVLDSYFAIPCLNFHENVQPPGTSFSQWNWMNGFHLPLFNDSLQSLQPDLEVTPWPSVGTRKSELSLALMWSVISWALDPGIHLIKWEVWIFWTTPILHENENGKNAKPRTFFPNWSQSLLHSTPNLGRVASSTP